MISELQTITRLLASVKALEIDTGANENDSAEYYKTQYVYPVRDEFMVAREFCIDAGLVEDLKNKLKSAPAKYLVVKNSLCISALKEMHIDNLADMVEGSCAISYTDKDPVAASKILVDFSKANEKFKLKGGYADGEVLSLGTLKELASMPPREVLLARLVSAMNSPVTGFVTACSGIIKKFLYAINEIIKKKEENK